MTPLIETPNTFYGMKIISNDMIPEKSSVLEISASFEWITADRRAEINGWLMDVFGERPVFYMVDGDKVLLHPSNYYQLRKEIERQKQ